jgi:1-acyl-sn-glycerol-3-phosphate acyltransferase
MIALLAQMGGEKARRSRSWRWLHGARDPHWGASPEGYDAVCVERAKTWLGRLFGPDGHYPVRAQGLDALPSDPALFVSNHSGGSTVLDCVGLAFAWYDHFGRSRPLHFLAHEILLATSLTGPFFHKVGVLRASRHLAHQALGEWGRDVAVMPGGDRDTWRPWKDRYRVEFAGHTGYARVALKSGVPIVPVAHAGPHDTFMVLTDGRRIAKRLRLHDLFRIDVFPIHLSLPWGVGIGPWPHIPLPHALRYRFGEPVQPPAAHRAGQDPPEALVREYDRQVRQAMQRLLDELADEDPLGRRGTPRRRVRRTNLDHHEIVDDEVDAPLAAE